MIAALISAAPACAYATEKLSLPCPESKVSEAVAPYLGCGGFSIRGEAQQAEKGQQQDKRGDGRGARSGAHHAAASFWATISAARCGCSRALAHSSTASAR